MKKILLIVLSLFVLAVACAGLWAYYAFLYTKPLTKAELAQLTPDWSVVTHGNWSPWFTKDDGTTEWNPAASFNAWLASVPEEDKAWPVLGWAAYEHVDIFTNENIGTLPESAEESESLIQLVLGDKADQLYAMLDDALRRPVMGCELRPTTDPVSHEAMLAHGYEDEYWSETNSPDMLILGVLLPTLGTQRRCVYFLKSRAAMKLEQGELGEYLRIIDLLLASSNLPNEFPVLVGQLVSVAVQGSAFDLIEWGLINHADRFSEEDIEYLVTIIQDYRRYSVIGEGESIMIHDAIRRSADDQGNLDKKAAWAVIKSLSGDAFVNHRACALPVDELAPVFQRPLYDIQRTIEQMERSCEMPWDESAKSSEEVILGQLDNYHVIIKLLLGILWPASDNFAMRIRQHQQRADALYLALVVHKFQIEHGEFPPSFEAIQFDPEYDLPIDAFDGATLNYVLKDNGPIIYSVGTDRDDDGGVPMRKYDISDLDSPNQVMTNWKNKLPSYAKAPHWLNQSKVDEINKRWPEKIDGDWILYPKPKED